MRWQSSRTINAPATLVFRTVADPTEFQQAIGADPAVQFLTERHVGVGTRFRASRVNKGKMMAFEQEVTEYTPNRVVRMINVTHGVLWDSTFEIESSDNVSKLTLTMYSRTSNPIKRLMMRAIAPMVQRGLDKDLEATKAYAERVANGGSAVSGA
jgi:uncharacterized protein YndB with AHSA1/START domain